MSNFFKRGLGVVTGKDKNDIITETADELKKDEITALVETPRVGKLHVKIAQAADICCRNNPNLYATAALGECRVATHVDLDNGSFPVWEEAWDLEVGDVTTNLVILIHDAHEITGDHIVGRVIVPLANLMNLRTAKKEESAWFNVFPPAPACRGGEKEAQIEAAIPGVQGSAMHKGNKGGYGMINLGLQLTLDQEKALAYLKAAPFDVDRVGIDDQSTFNSVQFREVAYRLGQLFSAPSFLLALKEPFVLAYTQLWWLYLCFFAADWFQPIALVVNLAWMGAMSAQYRTQYNDDVILWEEELLVAMQDEATKSGKELELHEKDDSGLAAYLLAGTIGQVLKLISGLFGVALGVLTSPAALGKALNGLTKTLEDITSLLEKVQQIFTWADPIVTVMATASLLAAMLPISLFFYFIPISAICWLIGAVVLFLPMQLSTLKDYAPKLEVCIKNVKNLIPTDDNGLSDPFIKITLDGAWGVLNGAVAKRLQEVGPVQYDCLNAEWDIEEDGDGRFVFPVELVQKHTRLTIHLYDDDGLLGSQHVGLVSVPLFDLTKYQVADDEATYMIGSNKRSFDDHDLKRPKKRSLLDDGDHDNKGKKSVFDKALGGVKKGTDIVSKHTVGKLMDKEDPDQTVGTINFSLNWLDGAVPNKKPWHMVVIQHIAVWDLLAMDQTGILTKIADKSDPYVVIEHGEDKCYQKQKTSVTKDTLEATWECNMRFDIESEDMHYPLVITVYDSDIDFDDVIGKREIDLGELTALCNNKAGQLTRQLRSKSGEISGKRGNVRIEAVYDLIEADEEIEVALKKAKDARQLHKRNLIEDVKAVETKDKVNKPKDGDPKDGKHQLEADAKDGLLGQAYAFMVDKIKGMCAIDLNDHSAKYDWATKVQSTDIGRFVKFLKPKEGTVRLTLAAAGVKYNPELIGPMLDGSHRIEAVDEKHQLVTIGNYDNLAKGKQTVELPLKCIAWDPIAMPPVGLIIKNFLARVPDKKEEVHRMLCSKLISKTYGKKGQGKPLTVLSTNHHDEGSILNMYKKTDSKGAFFTFNIEQACEHLMISRAQLEEENYHVYMAHCRPADSRPVDTNKKLEGQEDERPETLAKGRVVLSCEETEKGKPLNENGVGRWKALRHKFDIQKYVDRWSAPKMYNGKAGWFQVGDFMTMCVLDDDLFAGEKGHDAKGPPRIADMEDDATAKVKQSQAAMKLAHLMKQKSTVTIQAVQRGGATRTYLQKQREEAARLAEDMIQKQLDEEMAAAEAAANNPEAIKANFEMMKMDVFASLKKVHGAHHARYYC
jgi:hypothetical protein